MATRIAAGTDASNVSSVGPVEGRLPDGAVPVFGCADGAGEAAALGVGDVDGLCAGDGFGPTAWLDAGGALDVGALELCSRF